MDWCIRRGKDPMHVDLVAILSFLTSLFDSFKSYSSNNKRSMLSMTLNTIDGFKIGSHPMVTRLLKGCYNLNPPKPKYNSTWDPDVVLSFFRRSANNEDLSLARLSAKLVTLLALSSLLRVSEIAGISFNELNVSFQLSRPRKAQHRGPLHVITIPRGSDSQICPVSCLGSYIYKTDPVRTDAGGGMLILSIAALYHKVTGSTVAKWIKSILKDAGLGTEIFSAHSTRGASASKALANGSSTDSILRAAHWSSENTFNKFYRREVRS